MVIILMGVAGSGKTTVGEVLARRLGWPFHDADDLHPAANREKMSRGLPLTDDDRRPWLDAVRGLIEQYVATGDDAIVACSSLKQWYRDRIIADPAVVKLVYLKGSFELIAARLAARHGHFFDPALLRSQFDTLEEPPKAIVENVSQDAEAIAGAICSKVLARLD
jgi:gluconokinase